MANKKRTIPPSEDERRGGAYAPRHPYPARETRAERKLERKKVEKRSRKINRIHA